jgi:hypothetical protein
VTGSCHCGAVKISLSKKPEYMFDCNCSNCSKHGVLWGYFSPSDVSISGETKTYLRKDRDSPSSCVHFCAICGCTTHWSPTINISQEGMGANMRMFASEELAGIALHYPDGKNWSGQGAFGMRRESSIYED